MLFCKEIEGLRDDDFQGSINEHHIFAEVLFGNNHGNTSQKCLVTGVINFECDYSKQRDVLLCSNTENSALISQADSCNVKEDSRANSGPGFYSEGCALLTRNGHDGNGKRIKLSVDELSYSRPYSRKILNSSAPLKGVVSSISHPASPSVCHAVTCHLVESSSVGVTSSCCLVKCHAETNSGGNMGDKDVSKSRLSNMDGNDEKEVGASKAIASPVSQESSVTKLLVTAPSVNVGNQSGSLRCAKEKIKPPKTHELSVAKISPNRDFLKDPRPLLRNHVQNLLRAAGWEIGRRKREDNINGEFIYLSPKAVRPIREFRRAWNSCGQSLFAEINIVVQEDGKLWADMNDFWSDLSNTLIKIEELNNKETTAAALAQWWCLLDPFANMVFIDKKLGTLKAGEVVRARRCLVSDASTEDDAIVALNSVDSFGNKSGRYSLDGLHDSSVVRESTLTNSEGNYSVCNEKCGSGISEIFYQLQTGTGKAVKGASAYLCGEKCTRSRDTVNRTGARHEEISGNKRSEQDLNSLQALGAYAICDHSSSCLFEVPITSGNSSVVLEGSETVFSYQDYNTNSPNGDRYRSEYVEEMTLEVGKVLSVGGGKSFSGEITDKVENQLKGSLDNHLNCRNGLARSNNQNITNVPFSTCLGSFSSRPSLVEDNHLEDVDDRRVIWKVSGQHSIESEFGINGSSSVADAILRRKGHKKSKKITEIKLAKLCQSDRLHMYSNKSEGHGIEGNSFCSDSGEVQECFIATDIRNDRSCKKSFICSSQCQTRKKELRFRKSDRSSCSSKNLTQFFYDSERSKELNFENISDEAPRRTRNKSLDPETSRQGIKSEKPETQSENGQKRSIACQLKDDDLLISAVIENKTFRSATKQSTCKPKSYKSKALRKHKSQKGSCRLLPRSLSKGGKHIEGRWSIFGARTVLSWLLDSGVVCLDEVIQYRNPKDDAVIKYGLVTRDGILCKCCGKVLSVSEFKIHAGFKLNRPCLNLVMESGKSFTLCQLEAWSAEYKARKSAIRAVHVDGMDQNDDSCGLCGDGGELICCDNCPSTFHQTCLCTQELPEGSWYCSLCSCRICGDVVNDKETSTSPGALKCSQCEHKYHGACLKEKGTYREVAFGTWFCGENCQEVYVGLQSRIGLVNLLSDGFSWTLLRCIHGDQRVHSAQRFVALKAECNTKLAVALTIMEECFISMVDPRTGIHMIPHILYNWGSQFARLNYHGFYTVVLEKDDVLMSVASIRIHGVTVAEMPLIATCSKYRRQGMCRLLMNSIEEMLKSFKVEKLVVSAIPSLVETWTAGFGFKPLEDTERKSLSNINLMVFPGTVWLKKPLYQAGSGHAASSNIDDPTETGVFSRGEPTMYQSINYSWSLPREVSAVQTEIGHREEGNNEQDGILQEHFPKVSCEEPQASTVGATQPKPEMACLVESVVMYDEKKLFLDEQLLRAELLQNNVK